MKRKDFAKNKIDRVLYIDHLFEKKLNIFVISHPYRTVFVESLQITNMSYALELKI